LNESFNITESKIDDTKQIKSEKEILEEAKSKSIKTTIGTDLGEDFLKNFLNTKLKENLKIDTIQNIDIELDTDLSVQESLLNTFDNDSVSLITQENTSQTEESKTARQMLIEYEAVMEKRMTNLNKQISIIGLEDIEVNRNLFATIDDLESDDLGELFEVPAEITEYNQESSSSSSSDESEGITWYQLVPTTSLIEGTYNYDEKCKKSMMNLNLFLVTIFTEKDLHEMIRNKQDLALILTLCNNILNRHTSLNLSKSHKALIKALIYSLKNVLRKNQNTYFCFDTNMGIKWSNNKINFFAMLPVEDKQLALERASANPLVKYANHVENCSSGVSWLVMPLLQEDLDDFFSKGFLTESFHKNTPFTHLLNDFIPRLQKTEFKLRGKYNF